MNKIDTGNIEYNVGFDIEEIPQIVSENPNFPIVFKPRDKFKDTIIPDGIVYFDVDYSLIYVGDGITPGGFLVNSMNSFDGIDGGLGLNPRY